MSFPHESAVALSKFGFTALKSHEGWSSNPYLDVAKIPTIGYGFTYYPNGKKVTMADNPMSKEEGDRILRKILADFEDAINDLVVVPLTQNQFDALVSFVYNVGINAFKNSTLLRELNMGRYEKAADQFARWNKAGGRVVQGLVNRRRAERSLFLMG